jgi:hypothetical protein
MWNLFKGLLSILPLVRDGGSVINDIAGVVDVIDKFVALDVNVAENTTFNFEEGGKAYKLDIVITRTK